MKKIKALALLSGGLDSILAIKLIQSQGIEVEAINFVSPFCLRGRDGCDVHQTTEKLNVPLKTFKVGKDYLEIVRKPKYGYGKNLNPCIDCRIFLLKQAWKYAKKTRMNTNDKIFPTFTPQPQITENNTPIKYFRQIIREKQKINFYFFYFVLY